jgi:hypothetical protein
MSRAPSQKNRIALVAIVFLLTLAPMYLVLANPESAGAKISISNIAQNAIQWSSLHGVNYLYAPYLMAWNPVTLDPASSFPLMKADGFNLIRVEIAWSKVIQNQSGYFSALKQVASLASQNGLYIVWDNAVLSETGWPDCVTTQYSTSANFYAAWWADQVVCSGLYNPSESGVNGWVAMWNQYWLPTIQTVDPYPSTLGYEGMNEPPLAPSGETQQTFNQWFYNQVRTVSSKAVVFDPPYGNPGGGGGPIKGTSAAQNVKPIGNNIVLDYHDYGATGSQLSGDVSQWTAVTGLSGSFMGEFGLANPTDESSSFNYFVSVYPSLKQYGSGSTVFAWQCSAPNNRYQLLTSSCQQYYVDTAIVNAYNQVYGGGGVTTTSTAQSSLSSSSTLQTSSLSTTTVSSTTSSSSTSPVSTSTSTSSSFTTSSSAGSTSTASNSTSSSTTSNSTTSISTTTMTTITNSTSLQTITSSAGSTDSSSSQDSSTLTSGTSSSYVSTIALSSNEPITTKSSSISSGGTNSTQSSQTNPISGALAALSQSKNPPLAFSLASYEIALIIGLPLMLWTVKGGIEKSVRNRGWRW